MPITDPLAQQIAAVNAQRERDTRVMQVDTSRFNSLQTAIGTDPTASAADGNGYWNGGTFVSYFRLNVSALVAKNASGDVLE